MAEVPWGYKRLWASGRKRAARFRAGASDFDAIFQTTVRTRLVPMRDPALFDCEIDSSFRPWSREAYEGSLAQRAVDNVFRELFVNGRERNGHK